MYVILILSTTPEKSYHCTLQSADLMHFFEVALFSEKSGFK